MLPAKAGQFLKIGAFIGVIRVSASKRLEHGVRRQHLECHELSRGEQSTQELVDALKRFLSGRGGWRGLPPARNPRPGTAPRVPGEPPPPAVAARSLVCFWRPYPGPPFLL